MTGHVFHDPTGKRRRHTNRVVAIIAGIVIAFFAAFLATLVFAPDLPYLKLQDPRVLGAVEQGKIRKQAVSPQWKRFRTVSSEQRIRGEDKPISVAFTVEWDKNSVASLKEHIERVDVIAPQWITLKDGKGNIDVTSNGIINALASQTTRPVRLLPVIHNSHDRMWDQKRADDLILSPAAQRKLMAQMINLAKQRGYQGYVFDLENLSDRGAKAYPGFLKKVHAAFKTEGLELWATVPMGDDNWPIPDFADVVDVVVVMAYDEHYLTSAPGPIASQGWFQRNINELFQDVKPNQIVLALASYGYDWRLPAPGEKNPPADAMSFSEASAYARDANVKVALDSNSLNPNFGYTSQGTTHQVWFTDAVTMYNQIKVAEAYTPLGYGVWRLGTEDPGVWQLMGKRFDQIKLDTLKQTYPGTQPDFQGTGEILKIVAEPANGVRDLSVDATTGLIVSEDYKILPTPYVIERYGAKPGYVALTFDDGPDEKWTSQILDVLKQKGVKATFFMIGQNMARYPDVVERTIDEGHIVGGHSYSHPNIGTVSVPQVVLELNATQRLFETITGRSQRFFRPPFFGDAEPSTPSEVRPLLRAQELGYLNVGLRIDTDDWKKPSAEAIVERAMDRIHDTTSRPGQVVLLHDSGGDRTETVKALPILIDRMRAEGYRFVTVAQLADMTVEQAMPMAERAPVELFLDRLGFSILRFFDIAGRFLLIAAIALGAGRLAFMSVMALTHTFTIDDRLPDELDPETGPMVTVMVPCFNEEKVIVQSVGRILESNWKNLEIIVLDDGSKDRTADLVREHYGHEPRVRLMSFENGGKARALNRGLEAATGEIVVALDADTLFPPETIGLLARWFVDEKIAAVAGNALVGNRVNLITRWQALEYITAQNLERRALAALGAVTVVPGAVGAWRKSALLQMGGYPADTLAEDQDLTLAVQAAGWRVEFDPQARAYTEAPDTVAGLLKQRFRWSFGTLQCLWKHRKALFSTKTPALGFIALPQIWLFQIVLAAAAPLVDLAVIFALLQWIFTFASRSAEWSPVDLQREIAYWVVFVLIDLAAGALGMLLEKRAPWGDLIWMPVQRFGYRQLMYYVVLKSVVSAIHGAQVGWGKLERKASVKIAGQTDKPTS